MIHGTRQRPVVTFVYRWIPAYRVAFYEGLMRELDRRGIEMRVVYGKADGDIEARGDSCDVAFAERRTWRYFGHGSGRHVIWQPVLDVSRSADLVIVEQAAKLLVNYPLWLLSYLGGAKLAFWGHGRNFQRGSVNPFAEWIKAALSRQVHWWFAYNAASAGVVEALGYPRERITVVMNSTDTRSMRSAVEECRRSSDVGQTPVVIFVGGLYPDKRVQAAVEAVALARQKIIGLQLEIVGEGPDRPRLERTFRCEIESGWLTFRGALFGRELAYELAAASVSILPSAVGLAVVDSFAAGLPVLTADGDAHGPEFEYLDPSNSVVLPLNASSRDFAEALVDLLSDRTRLGALRAGAWEMGSALSVELMVSNFADGIEKALEG